jgi:hypothetical protein
MSFGALTCLAEYLIFHRIKLSKLTSSMSFGALTYLVEYLIFHRIKWSAPL